MQNNDLVNAKWLCVLLGIAQTEHVPSFTHGRESMTGVCVCVYVCIRVYVIYIYIYLRTYSFMHISTLVREHLHLSHMLCASMTLVSFS